MALPYKPIEEETDPRLIQARRGFQVVPNVLPTFASNIYSPDTSASSPARLDLLGNATGTVESGANRMIVSPQGTTTNFPTSRDAVNQSVRRALTVRAAGQPVAPAGSPFLDPYQQSVQTRKQQTEDMLMAGKDRSQFKVEWTGDPRSPRPSVKRLTPQEQEQNWSDMNVAARAEITPQAGKSAVVPEMNVFEGKGNHFDSSIAIQGTKDRVVGAAYRELTRRFDQALDPAKAKWKRPESLEEAQNLVNSLGFDDRVGEHAEQAVTKWIQAVNPELYKDIINQRKVKKADDASYVQWARLYSDDPGVADLSDEDILSARTPQDQLAYERDPNAIRHMIDPATGVVVTAPTRALSPEETAQQTFKQEKAKAKFELQDIQEQVNQSGGELTIDYRHGVPELINRRQLQRELDQEALAQSKEERDRESADIEALREDRVAKRSALETTPVYRAWAAKEKAKAASKTRMVEFYSKQYERNIVAGMMDPKEIDRIYKAALERLDTNKRYMPEPEPREEPVVATLAAPAPTASPTPIVSVRTPEEYAAVSDGTKVRLPDGTVGTKGGAAPAVKPVTEAVPYVAPVAQQTDIADQVPAMPKPISPREPTQTIEQRRAQIKATIPVPTASDLVSFARQKVKGGAFKALYNLLVLLTLPAMAPYKFGQWEQEKIKKLPDEAVKLLTDKYIEAQIDEQLRKQ